MDGSSFTPQLRKALAAAFDAALSRRQRELQSADLALGLVSVPEGGAAIPILHGMGVGSTSLYERLHGALPTGRDAPIDGIPTELAYTLDATHTLQRAIGEARRMKHDRTSTAPLLIAILREPEVAVARVLSDAGVTLEEVESETHRQAALGTVLLGEMITSPTRPA